MKHRTPGVIFAALVAAAAVLALAGCSLMPTTVAEATAAAAITPKVSSPTIGTDGVLVVGITGTSAPMSYVTSQGIALGIDVDVASAVADEMGLKVRFVQVTDAKTAASKGCDIFMSAKSGSASDMTVVGRYTESATAFFRKGSTATVTVSDVAGKTVGVQKGSASEATLTKSSLTVTIKEYSSLNDAFDGLNAGSCDYVLCDAYSGGYLATTYTGIALAGTIDTPTSSGIAVKTSNTELQKAILTAVDTISSNGKLSLIRTRWVGSMPSLSSSNQIQGITVNASTTSTAGSNAASIS